MPGTILTAGDTIVNHIGRVPHLTKFSFSELFPVFQSRIGGARPAGRLGEKRSCFAEHVNS